MDFIGSGNAAAVAGSCRQYRVARLQQGNLTGARVDASHVLIVRRPRDGEIVGLGRHRVRRQENGIAGIQALRVRQRTDGQPLNGLRHGKRKLADCVIARRGNHARTLRNGGHKARIVHRGNRFAARFPRDFRVGYVIRGESNGQLRGFPLEQALRKAFYHQTVRGDDDLDGRVGIHRALRRFGGGRQRIRARRNAGNGVSTHAQTLGIRRKRNRARFVRCKGGERAAYAYAQRVGREANGLRDGKRVFKGKLGNGNVGSDGAAHGIASARERLERKFRLRGFAAVKHGFARGVRNDIMKARQNRVFAVERFRGDGQGRFAMRRDPRGRVQLEILQIQWCKRGAVAHAPGVALGFGVPIAVHVQRALRQRERVVGDRGYRGRDANAVRQGNALERAGFQRRHAVRNDECVRRVGAGTEAHHKRERQKHGKRTRGFSHTFLLWFIRIRFFCLHYILSARILQVQA